MLLLYLYLYTYAVYTECNDKADIAFLIDSSGSIEPERFGKVTNMVKECIGNLSLADGKVRISY